MDCHPEHSQVALGSPCNGFGFKFTAATGEALACLATGATPPVDLTPWRLPPERPARAKVPLERELRRRRRAPRFLERYDLHARVRAQRDRRRARRRRGPAS